MSLVFTILWWVLVHVFRRFLPFAEVVPALAPPIHFEISPVGPQSWEEARIADEALFGDPRGDMRFNYDIDDPSDAVGEKNSSYYWPIVKGKIRIIPYEIDKSFTKWQIDLLDRAFAEYKKHTCIQFQKRTNQTDYVFITQKVGCWSFIGRQGGKQELSLGKGCHYIGTYMHEIGHACGMYHEQQRNDRDQYINVYLQNVKPAYKSNFEKISPSRELTYTPYDCDSIMQYGEYAFSKDDDSKTMEGKDKNCKLRNPYAKSALTARDWDLLNKMYQCK